MSWLVGGYGARSAENQIGPAARFRMWRALPHDVLLDLLLGQPRRGAKREDGDRQYLASVIVLVPELDIGAIGLPVIFRVDEFEGHGGSLD